MESTRKSIGYTFATQYLELSIQFLGVLILARLLSPADTGVYSVAAFLMLLLHAFRDFGVVNFIIQETELTREKIQSAFGVAIILALLVAAIMLLSCDAVARFYNNIALRDIMQIMALSFAISPFGSLLIGIYRREMQFKTIFFIKTFSAICHVLIATTLAYRGYGAASLAWANFAGILSFGLAANLFRPKGLPYLPRFTHIRTILSFGGMSSFGNAANTIGSNSADLIIAKQIDMMSVGYFSRGNGLVQLFARLIASALTPVALPYFSKIKRNGDDLKKPYLLAINYLTVLAWPFFAVMALLAYPIVRFLYGLQWDASVPVVELLCVAGAISSMSIFSGHVMIANGQIKQATVAQLLSQPVKVVAVLIASVYGLRGISLAIIAGEFVSFIIVNRYLKITIGVTMTDLAGSFKHSAVVTLFSIAGPLLVNLFWNLKPDESLGPLLVGGLSSLLGWLIGITIIKHPFYYQLQDFFSSLSFPISAAYTGKKSAVQFFKSGCKYGLYQSGLMGFYHRLRNKKSLTVAMFHRVLPTDSTGKHSGADPVWSMSTQNFRQCLKFFKKHYHVVSMRDLNDLLIHKKPLPSRSLLITFDDGWSDTAQHAQPLLEEFNMSSVVFITGSVIDQAAPFWQEAVFSLLSSEPDGIATLNNFLVLTGIETKLEITGAADIVSIRKIIRQLENQDAQKLYSLSRLIHEHFNAPPAMLTLEQLKKLAVTHSIGSHGYTHQPLTQCADPAFEVIKAREDLSACLGGSVINLMSFPHGAYNDAVIAACRSADYQFLFSSDMVLNRASGHQLNQIVLGRIAITEQDITDERARFYPFLLAFWLFPRPLGVIQSSGGRNE